MGSLNVKFYLNGFPVNPVNWRDVKIDCIYDDEAQPTLANDEYTFVNEDAQLIMDWVASKPFEGMPFILQVYDGVNGLLTINGCLDFTEMYEVRNESEVKVKIKPDNNIGLTDERLEALSYGYLARDPGGIIGKDDYVDVPVIVKRKFDGLETAFAAMALYFMGVQVADFSKNLKAKIIDNIVIGLESPLSKPAAAFKAIGYAILYVAYYAFILVALIPMVKKLKQYLIPTKTVYKGMFLRKALTKACDHLQLEFVSNIPELDYYVYLPSKTDDKIRFNSRQLGIPNNSDYGYQLDEMFTLCERLFNAQRIKIDNKMYLYAKKDPFWYSITNYVLPGVLKEENNFYSQPFEYNFKEMIANYIFAFEYDASDEWTMPSENQKNDYFVGTNFQVITDLDNTFVNEKYKLNKGLKEINPRMALGARRDRLSLSEQATKGVLAIADLFIKLAGGKTFGEKINEHRGALQISQNFFNTAKLLVIKDGIIPANHRSLLSASRLYNEYHYWESFYTNGEHAQKKIYKDVKIPFDFEAFTKVIKTGYFTTEDSKQGKFRNISWTLDKDYAIVTYEVSEKYAFNLVQKEIEA